VTDTTFSVKSASPCSLSRIDNHSPDRRHESNLGDPSPSLCSARSSDVAWLLEVHHEMGLDR
jgi:hypothetical protein